MLENIFDFCLSSVTMMKLIEEEMTEIVVFSVLPENKQTNKHTMLNDGLANC